MIAQRWLPVYATLCLTLILAGCGAQQNLAFEVLDSDSYAPGSICRGDEPDLFIIASRDETAPLGLAKGQFLKLERQMQSLDFQQRFIVAVCRGTLDVTSPLFVPEVHQVTRRGEEVTVQTHFSDLLGTAKEKGANPAGSDPYVAIAVTKDGAWGLDIRFILEIDGEEVRERMHYVP